MWFLPANPGGAAVPETRLRVPPPRARAFSLVELAIVVVVIGMLAAMVIPRVTNRSNEASVAATDANNALLASAITRYYAEHQGLFPTGSGTQVARRLTGYTDKAGNISSTRTAPYLYGPYLGAIPPLLVGAKSGNSKIAIDSTNSPPASSAGADAGWIYNPSTGQIVPNIPSAEAIALDLKIKPKGV